MTDRIVLGKDGTRYFLGSLEVTEAEYRALYPLPEQGRVIAKDAGGRAWPIHSEALGVHSKRRTQAIEDARAKGVPTEFDHHGRPVFTDRGHRRRYLRAYAYHDNNGGYGD